MVQLFRFTRTWRFIGCLLLWSIGANATNRSDPPVSQRQVIDADGDGVADGQDLCPNTPTGTAVSAYGCPVSLASCDYTTPSITLTAAGGSGNGTVRYVLADSTGRILQVSATPTFSGLTGTHTYLALTISHDGSVTGLSVGLSLSGVSAGCYDWSEALPIRVCVASTDTDGDRIPDEKDLCPNTPAGTPVNAYGCPLSLSSCDYTTASLTFATVGGSGNGTVRYVLADSVGRILQVSAIPTFSGLSGRHTYMALTISHDGSVTGLSVGQSLSSVSAGCYDWSEALPIKVCVASTDTDGDRVPDEKDLCPNTPAGTPVNAYGCPLNLVSCDYTTSSVSFRVGSSTGSGTLQYVLADSVGRILQISPAPSFSGLSGTHTYMALTISHDGSVTGLSVGQSLSSVSAGCYDWSEALPIKVCVPTGPVCDYTIGATISLTASGGNVPSGTLTRYLLVNAGGRIVRSLTQPVFATSGLASGTYQAYSVVYTDDQSVTNVQEGGLLAQVQANCIAFSAPLSLQLCSLCLPTCIPIHVTRVR